MKQGNAGSAILTVIITITLIMILAGTIMRSATLFHDFALQRVAHERQVQSLQALLNYGVAWCMVIEKQKTTDALYRKVFDQWPENKSPYSGEVEIRRESNAYQIHVTLKNDLHETVQLTRSVVRTSDNGLIIQ